MDEHNPFDFDILGAGDPRPEHPPAAPPSETPANPFDFDITGEEKPPESSATGAFARGVVRGAIPAAGGLVGAGAGAEAGALAGSLLGPAGAVVGGLGGAFVGGLAGGFGGSIAAERAQDYGLKKLPDSWVEAIGQDERQQRLDQEQHPYAAFGGGLAPFALTLRPYSTAAEKAAAKLALPPNATALQRVMANPAAARLFSGTLMGGIELGNEAIQGDVSWGNVAIATGFGVIFNKPNRFGEKLEGVVPRMLGRGAAHAAAEPRPPPGAEPPPPPQEPPFEEQGERFRGDQDYGYGELYPGLTEEPHEPDHTLADVEGSSAAEGMEFGKIRRPRRGEEDDLGIAGNAAYQTPTVLEGWGEGIIGPGRTEKTFLGQEQTPPEVEMAAQDAQRQEQEFLGTAPPPNTEAATRATHPEAFAELEALKAQQADLHASADPNPEHVAAIATQILDKSEEIAAARRRAAEKEGQPIIETPAPEPPKISADEYDTIVEAVKKEVIAAGRPAPEAEGIGHLVATQLAVRAEQADGRLGTPLELYHKEGAIFRGEGGKPTRVGGPPVAPGPANTKLSKPAPPAPAPPPGAKPPEPEAAPTPGESEQFKAYAKWIDEHPGEIPAGMREQIAADERLNDGEAARLLGAPPEAPTEAPTAAAPPAPGPPPAEPAADWAKLWAAYQDLKQESGGFSTVAIARLVERSGLPVETVHRLLVDAARTGDANLHNSNSVQGIYEPTAENRKNWITLPGRDSPVQTAELKNEVRSPAARTPHDAFLDEVKTKLIAGEKPFRTIVDARALAKAHGLEWPEGESANKHVDELVERAVVESARHIVEQHRAEGRPAKETYERIVKLYDDQPNLSTRTSTSVAEQAYSTPAPLAYVASRLAGIGPETRVLEPTAGNGMLLMEADPRHARVNELNRTRAASLREQGFKPSTADGAAESTFADDAGKMDVVIANPPFGTVREGGNVRSYTVDGWKTTQIDHAIALNALKTMKPDGKAVLIVGGVKADTAAERAAGYQAKDKRRFFDQLLSKYNVTDVFTVDGGLYGKQGAGWPVDVIRIEGKGKSAREFLTKEPPPLLKSWDEIGERLNGVPGDGQRAGLDGEDRPAGGKAAEGGGQPAPSNAVGGEPPVGGKPAGLGAAGKRPGVLDGTRNSSEPGDRGAEPPVAPGTGGAPGDDGRLRGTDPNADPDRGRPVAPPPAPERPAEYGANNTLVTKARADEVRARLRQKLQEQKSQLNAGIDPEFLQIGTELAVYHIEAGVRKFADFVAAMTGDLGAKIEDLKPYLRSWYNGSRDMMEDHGLDAAGMDHPDTVRTELDRLLTEEKEASERPPEKEDYKPPEPPPERKKIAEITDGQTLYEPASREGEKLNTLLPANLRDATNESLERLEREHGNVDEFVAKALGREPSELGKYFNAEQIDAIGLGISNIMKGEGFIIGDQTGIGKGRVVAAMISYAKSQNLIPVFVTQMPQLYGDMFRDMRDIGWHEQLGRPVDMMMTNVNTSVPLDEVALDWLEERDDAREMGQPDPPKRGLFTNSQNSKKASADMLGVLNGTKTPDVIFTTYSQMQSVAGKETDRRAFLTKLAPRSFLIMDEAHNAGGQAKQVDENGIEVEKEGPPARSDIFREAVANAHSVMYSSATYAKNPSVMTLYSKTDMAKAVDDVNQLPEVITKGGVPLQQIVAGMLAKAGQYLRRERSFDGVSYDHESVPVSEKAYKEFSGGLRSVFRFDQSFEEERARLAAKIAAQHGGGKASDTGVGGASATSTTFGSVMHNVINQMVVALKAQATADRAIQALKAGEKPVIALSKTNASFIKDMAELMGVKPGDVMDINFDQILKRYLERTRRVTIKLGNDETLRVTIPLEDMSPAAQAGYAAAQQVLRTMDIGDLPVSPIDHIRNELTKAGYSVREVTGRSHMLDYSGSAPVFTHRPASEGGPAGKSLTVKHFNFGKLDAIILNQSGSTGISLHSKASFPDQRRRRMIIAEADPNIDTHMQMLGRVHRTGQVIPPAYTHLSADIPAEARPTAVLMRKMASLNANTTGAKKSRFTAEAVDFLNKYGDRVAAQIMRDDPELHYNLGEPPAFDSKTGAPRPDAASKVTGKLTLLDPEDQQALLDKISARYKSLIEALDATGENDLEAKSVDLKARTLETQVLKAATGPSPFQGAVNLEKVQVKAQGRAFSPDEVVSHVEDALKVPKADRGFNDRDMSDLKERGKKASRALIERTEKAADERLRLELSVAKEDMKDKVRQRFADATAKFREIVDWTYPGSTLKLRMGEDETPAVVIDIFQEKDAKNPVALSTWTAVFAVPNSSRSFGVPLSRLSVASKEAAAAGGEAAAATDGAAVISPNYEHKPAALADMFEAARKQGTETRYMVTGNILAGYSKMTGQILNHTMEDGSTRSAILLNRSFDPKKFMAKRSVRLVNGDHVLQFMEQTRAPLLKSSDGFIGIAPQPGGRVTFSFTGGKREGGRYYTDQKVRNVYDGWARKGGAMQGSVPGYKAREVIDALQSVGAVFETKANQDVAEKLRPEGRTLAQGEDQGPDAKGRIRLRYPERSLITLLQKADASTAVHEIGHDWLEALKRDAAHPQASEQLRADWETTKRWAGIGEGDKIPEGAHEKFANGLVRYLWEGVAPSQAIARVFEAFRGWLRALYKSAEEIAAKHNIPLTPEMRQVYDRLLTREKRTVIAPDEEPQVPLHNIHTGEAAEIPAEHADAPAERIEAERPHYDDPQPPQEIANEIAEAIVKVDEAEAAESAGEAGGGDGGRGQVEPGGGAAGAEPAGGGVGDGGGDEREGGGAAASESNKPTAGYTTGGRPESGGAPGNAPLASRPAPILESPRRFLDKAANIRLDNINGVEDIKALMREMAEANNNFLDDRRRVVSDAQARATAEAWGIDKIAGKIIGEGWSVEENMLVQRLAGATAHNSFEKGRIAAETLKDADILAYAEAKQLQVMAQALYSRSTAETGRAQRGLRKIQEYWTPGAEAAARLIKADANSTAKAATGRTLYQLLEEAKLLAQFEHPNDVAAFIARTQKHSFGRMILEYWINGLISGPATHVTYTIGNALLALNKGLLETPVAAAIGAARALTGRDAGNVVQFGEAGARLRGLASGYAPAVTASFEALRTGITGRLPGQDALRSLPFQPEGTAPIAGKMLNEAATMADARGAIYGVWQGTLDGMLAIGKILQASPPGAGAFEMTYSPMGAIGDARIRGGVFPVGQLARMPSRSIAAIHTFFRAMNYSMEKNALIHRQAAGDAAKMADLRINTPDEIMNASTKAATDLTLMGQGGALVQHMSRLTNWAPNIPGLGETPILKFIDPFVHIAANVIDQSLVQRTPLGLLSTQLREDLLGRTGVSPEDYAAGKRNVAAQDMAQARMLVGSAMALGFGALAAGGYVTGSGPTDRAQAYLWRKVYQPHSVRIGDMWYQMNRLGPLGMLLSTSADLYDVAHTASQGDMLKASALLHHAIVQNVLDESFMRGPSELIQAIDDPGRYGERYIQNFASSFVPLSVGMAQTARASDPYSRQARTVMDSIRAKVPGLSEQLLPKRDIWGERMPNRDALVSAGVTAIYEQKVSHDPVDLALTAMGIGIAPPERTIRNEKLTDKQYDDYARLAGRMTKQRLDVYVRSPDWQQWSPSLREANVRLVYEQCKEAARGAMMKMYPSIAADATARLKQRRGVAR